MITTRLLRDDEFRAAHALFAATLHRGPAPDELWELVAPSYDDARTVGAFDGQLGGELVGTAYAASMPMTVPGGAVVPMSGVTRVGVRADRTRRGVLTGLMRAQLADLATRGEVTATLRASESAIYGRFGYGVATRGRDLEVDLRLARVRPGAPSGGDVRQIPVPRAVELLPRVYDRIGRHRPGAAGRRPAWWTANLVVSPKHRNEPVTVVVHTGPDGEPDGWAVTVPSGTGDDRVLDVHELWAAGPVAHAELWRHLLRADLVRGLRIRLQPLDGHLDLLLTDPRAVRTTAVDDEVWLRLVDVGAALRARSWGSVDPVVLRVHDPVLPANDGAYRVGASGVERLRDLPATVDLELDVAELAVLYLGDRRPADLAATGRITVADQAALDRVDALFAVDTAPWCGTYF